MTEKLAPERRRFVRVSADLPVKLKQIPQNNPVQIQNAISCDISEGGVQVWSFYFYPVQSRQMLEILLSPDTEPVRSVGTVVWIRQLPYQDRYKLGIEFSEMNEDGRLNLRELIA